MRFFLSLCGWPAAGALILLTGVCQNSATAQTVWDGPPVVFSKDGLADYLLPENQDHLTDSVILTRADSLGMFNIALETQYTRDGFLEEGQDPSPAGTLWATSLVEGNSELTIAADDFAGLTFVSWAAAFGGAGNLVGNITSNNAVVKLVGDPNSTSDDIYLDLQFTLFEAAGSGAPFAYQRSGPPIIPTGDYNGDTFVNAADYTVWRNTFGESVDFDGEGADGNGNGMIDAGDYTFWKERYGDLVLGAGAGLAATAIPEPATLALLFFAVGLICVRRRSSR
jgi:hypothetical protein